MGGASFTVLRKYVFSEHGLTCKYEGLRLPFDEISNNPCFYIYRLISSRKKSLELDLQPLSLSF